MDLMAARRRLLMQQQGGLPGAYRAVEYLGCTGTQYIDSGIECTSDLVVEARYSYSSNVNAAMCGGIVPVSGSVYFRHHCSPYKAPSSSSATVSHYWIQKNNSGNAAIVTTLEIDMVYTIFVDPVNGYATLNGNPRTFTPLESGLTTGKSYGIGARISNTGAVQSRPCHIYYFKFWRGSVQLGDFVPCIRKSDNVAGMFDLVTKTFFTNAGSGTFEIPT